MDLIPSSDDPEPASECHISPWWPVAIFVLFLLIAWAEWMWWPRAANIQQGPAAVWKKVK